jgi:hypothetical protein
LADYFCQSRRRHNQPLALFDAMFTQVAQMVAVPCTPAGVNSLTLTPIGSAPSFTSYQNFTSARFVASANSTGPVTAQFVSLANLPVYLADGATQATTSICKSYFNNVRQRRCRARCAISAQIPPY